MHFFFRNEETPVKSVLAVHGKIGNLLKLYNQKLQQTENTRRELEREVEDLKKQLGLNRKKGKQEIIKISYLLNIVFQLLKN